MGIWNLTRKGVQRLCNACWKATASSPGSARWESRLLPKSSFLSGFSQKHKWLLSSSDMTRACGQGYRYIPKWSLMQQHHPSQPQAQILVSCLRGLDGVTDFRHHFWGGSKSNRKAAARNVSPCKIYNMQIWSGSWCASSSCQKCLCS